jgi:hypothetical protein
MADFNVRADAVNVEQIMEQIRARIREKRGVDYTEQQIHELAAVKLEKFLDPKGVRSDLLDEFRKAQSAYEPPELPNYAFEESTLFESHRAPIRWMRKLFAPFLKLLFNPNPLIQALNIQARLNTMNAEREARREASRRALDQLYYELIHNLVLETTRTAIEVKNLKMRLESVSSRLEFNERRARALEGAVVYKPQEEPAPPPRPVQQPAPFQPRPSYQQQPQQHHNRPAPPPPSPQPAPSAPPPAGVAGPIPSSGEGAPGEGPGQRSRRRRRRRGRRGGGAAAAVIGASGGQPQHGNPSQPGVVPAPEEGDSLDDAADEGTEHEETSLPPMAHDLQDAVASAPADTAPAAAPASEPAATAAPAETSAAPPAESHHNGTDPDAQ